MIQFPDKILEKLLKFTRNLIIVELLFAAKCATVSVLHTNHPRHGDDGKYFFFDEKDFTKMVGERNWNAKTYEVIQRGSKFWTGKVIVWDGTTGEFAGSGRYSGRRDSDAVDGNWAAGDIIQLKACVEKGM